ncbi:MAG: hypothetical protein ACR2QL_08910 [Woeseiaceae bacterium]
MLLRRVTQHVREQDWTAIGIDFVIVVVGVFIGIQVSNWNDERESRVSEQAFVESIRNDIAQNINDSLGYFEMLSSVRDHGYRSLESFDSDTSCQERCWAMLVDFFIASQWIDIRTNRAMYDEIKRSGLPRDLALKAILTRYYGSTEQITIIGEQLPRFRELVRSVIPAAVQQSMWEDCIGIAGRQQIMKPECKAPISNAEASAIIDTLHADKEIETSLTYWMSTIGVLMIGLKDQNTAGQEVINQIEQYLEVY